MAITTDSNGLTAGLIQIPTADGSIPGYRAAPAEGASFPVVLVVQEIFGVNEYMQDVCRRFAKAGYLAVAPELYARQGDVSKLHDIQEIISLVVSKVPDAQVMSDLDAAVRWASERADGDASRLAISGFCWGGRIVWLYAAHNARLKAGAAWYGQLEGAKNEFRTRTAIEVAREVKAPVLGLYGGQDHGIPHAHVEQMREGLRAAGNTSEIIVYPNAPHAFHADYRSSYREADAADAWARQMEWFKRHGVAARS